MSVAKAGSRSRSPGIEQPSDVGEIVEHGKELPSHGQYDFVIGENPNDIGKIIVSILGGAIVAAEALERPVEHETAESNCNGDDFVVETKNERNNGPDNPDHTIRDEKPINDLDELDKLIKNPDKIVEFGPRRYLLKEMDGGKTAVVKLHRNFKYDHVFELITQLTDAGELFDSLRDSLDTVKDEDGSDPTQIIDC